MKYSVEIAYSGSFDASPSIVFKFDSKHYLFNCGEVSQRFFIQHKLKISRIEQLFATKFDWNAIGGIPGFLLTRNDASPDVTHLHGPFHMPSFLKSLHRFLPQASIRCQSHEMTQAHSGTVYYEDKNLKMIPFFTFPSSLDSNINDTKKLFTTDSFSRKRNLSASSFSTSPPSLSLSSLSPKRSSNLLQEGQHAPEPRHAQRESFSSYHGTCVSYVCIGPEVRGKFDEEKAKALRIPHGPIRSKIIRQGSATLEDGTVINRDMVVGPRKPSYQFFILELPTLEHVYQLRHDPKFKSYMEHPESPCIAFHMLGPSIVNTAAFQSFLASFTSPCVKHYLFTPEHQGFPVLLPTSACAHALLHQVLPHVFLPYQSSPLVPLPATLPSNAYLGTPMTELHIEPKFDVTYSELSRWIHSDVPISEWDMVKQTQSLLKRSSRSPSPSSKKGFVHQASSTSPTKFEAPASPPLSTSPTPSLPLSLVTSKDEEAFVHNPHVHSIETNIESSSGAKVTSCLKDEDWLLVPLGTGSACPSLLRNVSSILLSTPSMAMLLDCGEGTMHQLARLFPMNDCDNNNNNNNTHDNIHNTSRPPASLHVVYQRYPHLKAFMRHLQFVFISHMHADHHLGLVQVLRHVDHPVTLIAPLRLWHYLERFNTFHPIPLHLIQYVNVDHILFEPRVHGASSTTHVHSPTTPTTSSPFSSTSSTSPPVSFLSKLSQFHLDALETCDVIHRASCYGIRIASGDQSVVYSGDTRPCPKLIELGKKGRTNVLIHEATFDADRQEEAILKTHSTITEAMDVFRKYVLCMF
ncbi:hypothetical protein HMI54_001047 [Coelomomyces lativittatus]|nr:hypothetical protein HMI54_001047 [Coelomomyces lativittatus]